ETYSSGKYHDEANKRINSLSQELKSKTWGKNKEVVGVFFLLIIFLCYKWYFVPDSNPHHFEPNFDRVKSYIQSGELSKAYEEIKLALDDQDLVNQSETFLLKGIIETKLFAMDSSNTENILNLGRTAFGSFKKTMELENNDSSSNIGKEVYKPFLDSVSENFQGEGVMFLKHSSFNKAMSYFDV